MNDLIPTGGPATTMTSREIAELTGKRHDNVMTDIRKMLAELHGEGRVLSFQETVNRPNPSGGATIESIAFKLPKRETLILVSGYSVVMRAKIIDRWQELEAQPALNPANFSRMQLIELAMQAEQERIESEQKRLVLEIKVAEQAPKIEAFDRIATSDGSLCITDAAKTLQIQPRKLTQLLQEHHWTYRRPMGTGWLAYQDRIQQGLMEHKVTTGEKSDGREWSNTQARITPKGLTKLAEVVRQAGLH